METPQIHMVRMTLDEVPPYPLPEGYRFRLFHRGDERNWLQIHKQAETHCRVTRETFEEYFNNDLSALRRRMMFLVAPDGQDVGTTTAWYEPKYRYRPWGRIHWVAIVPEHRGRGLAKPMVTAAMHRMRSLGHRRAVLTTQPFRIPAIKLYLDLGFVPDMTAPDAETAWAPVREKLPYAFP